jgi:hypothetical protein
MAGSENHTAEAVKSLRRREAIEEIQRAVARQLRNELQPPKSMPQRLADLARELHRRLRNVK